ncbi:hypothetical protein FOA22_03340 [Heyndrickxia oleronia]|uniref:hypothetical protein n=1 Tax=Heyndrickxia oleronia TaxID=38875 RepID=UPI003337AEE2
MEEVTAKVNKITGQTYGSQGEYIITFHMDNSTARYAKSYSKKYGYYHIDYDDIQSLQMHFPEYIPYKDNNYYGKYVIEWGYDVEEGLCKLMIEGKLTLERKKQDSKILVKFEWVGEPWDAEENRKLKRRFPNRNL